MKALRIVSLVFAVLGIALFLTGNLISESNDAWYEACESTTGVITALTEDSSFTVRYSVAGHSFDKTYSLYASSMFVGKELTVYYPEDDPTAARTQYNDLPFFVLRIIGIVFISVALLQFIIAALCTSSRKRTLQEGNRITAKIVGIQRNRNVRVNNQYPWQIVCEGVDPVTGASRRFVSPNLYKDPNGRLLGDTVDVAVRGRHAVVDLSRVLPGDMITD